MRKNVIISLFLVVFVWLTIMSVVILNNLDNNSSSKVEQVKVSGFSTDFTEVVKACKSSMVIIEQNGVLSSGFIYKQNDSTVYIATCFHGVSESDNVNITFNNGVKVAGKLHGSDFYADVALVECEFPYVVEELKIGDSTLLNDGEFLLSIGTNNSLEYAFSSKLAMVSKRYQEIKNHISFNENEYEYYLGLIGLSGDFTSGFSGAPVLNMNGELVGLILMREDDLTLALTGNELKMVLDNLYHSAAYRRVDFGFRGKYIKDLENYEASSLNINVDLSDGYYVSDVTPFSLASKAGILRGDVIVKINDVKLADSDSMLELIYSNENDFVFEIIRNGDNLKLMGMLND